MLTFNEWFPLVAVGVPFTLLGLLKLYGLRRGIKGGSGKPLGQKLCGS
ncbi:MAG: hypothetical protein HY300_06590 [Verrucomicrobia bacterium]|nr:hypothetical protein [Verrucomicrobiota bacterium]